MKLWLKKFTSDEFFILVLGLIPMAVGGCVAGWSDLLQQSGSVDYPQFLALVCFFFSVAFLCTWLHMNWKKTYYWSQMYYGGGPIKVGYPVFFKKALFWSILGLIFGFGFIVEHPLRYADPGKEIHRLGTILVFAALAIFTACFLWRIRMIWWLPPSRRINSRTVKCS